MPPAITFASSTSEDSDESNSTTTDDSAHDDPSNIKTLFRITQESGRVTYHIVYNDGHVRKVSPRHVYNYASPDLVRQYEHESYAKGTNMETVYQKKHDMGGWSRGTPAAVIKKMEKLVNDTKRRANHESVETDVDRTGSSTESEDLQQMQLGRGNKRKAAMRQAEPAPVEQPQTIRRLRRLATVTDDTPLGGSSNTASPTPRSTETESSGFGSPPPKKAKTLLNVDVIPLRGSSNTASPAPQSTEREGSSSGSPPTKRARTLLNVVIPSRKPLFAATPTKQSTLLQFFNKPPRQPLSEQPPPEQPPSEQPPSEQPPSEQLPSEQSPSEQPPSEQPPSEQPPSEQPPSEQPPSEQLHSEQLPSEQSPSEQPPSEQLPSEQLPSDQLPSEQLPSEQLPSEQPSPTPRLPGLISPVKNGAFRGKHPMRGASSGHETDDSASNQLKQEAIPKRSAVRAIKSSVAGQKRNRKSSLSFTAMAPSATSSEDDLIAANAPTPLPPTTTHKTPHKTTPHKTPHKTPGTSRRKSTQKSTSKKRAKPIEPPTEWEVECIVDHRFINCQKQYLVKWVGFPHSDNTWEPSENLEGSFEIVAEYEGKIDDL